MVAKGLRRDAINWFRISLCRGAIAILYRLTQILSSYKRILLDKKRLSVESNVEKIFPYELILYLNF